jgi:exonuclease SbcC
LCNEIQPYFTENIDKNNLKQSLELLANRSAHWKKNRQDSEEKKSQKARLEPELARLTANAESENERLNSLVNTCQTLQAKLEPLRDLELETFNYEQEKDKLTQTIKQAEEKVNALREKLQQQTVELTKLRSNEQNWSSQLERQTHELETIQQHLVEGITLAGFSNEIDLQEALSPEPETVRRIETEIRELEDKKLILESQIQGQTQTIDNFEAKLPSEATTENLLAEGNKLKEQHAEALEKKSLCQHTLEQQEENIASAKQYTEQLDALQKKIKTWEKLTKMLGGKEGRLFNEFAQSLTLRLLLRKANKLLKDLTDRYVLISEKDAEGQQNTPEGYLDIWVRDHYKGASERPVKNLSGGETFLVSLALSLALSEFASRNVELKSLFIDEGFGTLDPDALKQAIESLQKLSLKDKSVGIISHVDALKESIPCQIQVEKNGITGTSTLRMVY